MHYMLADGCQKEKLVSDDGYLPPYHYWVLYRWDEGSYEYPDFQRAYICKVCSAEAVRRPRTLKEFWHDLFNDRPMRKWIAIKVSNYRVYSVRLTNRAKALPALAQGR